ncbi:hypothetical protein ATKI12_8851 [Kitasatospora sp. Ki12]
MHARCGGQDPSAEPSEHADQQHQSRPGRQQRTLHLEPPRSVAAFADHDLPASRAGLTVRHRIEPPGTVARLLPGR